jgi:hypothetical protein
MPSLADYSFSQLLKIINIGLSGSGKTGTLAELARRGWNLHILDYDNGLGILANLLADSPAALARIHYETLRDKIKLVNGRPRVASPVTAFKGAGKVLEAWDAANAFGPDDILVLETLTTFSEAGLNEARAMSNHLDDRPTLPDWGVMAEMVSNFIQMITDPGDSLAQRPPQIPCHVIVNTHIRFLEADEEAVVRRSQDQKERDSIDLVRGLPNAKGQEIPRNIGKFFNTVLLTSSKGSGQNTKRVISTRPQGVIEVKCEAPKTAKAEYPQDTGMADFFKDVLRREPGK